MKKLYIILAAVMVLSLASCKKQETTPDASSSVPPASDSLATSDPDGFPVEDFVTMWDVVDGNDEYMYIGKMAEYYPDIILNYGYHPYVEGEDLHDYWDSFTDFPFGNIQDMSDDSAYILVDLSEDGMSSVSYVISKETGVQTLSTTLIAAGSFDKDMFKYFGEANSALMLEWNEKDLNQMYNGLKDGTAAYYSPDGRITKALQKGDGYWIYTAANRLYGTFDIDEPAVVMDVPYETTFADPSVISGVADYHTTFWGPDEIPVVVNDPSDYTAYTLLEEFWDVVFTDRKEMGFWARRNDTIVTRYEGGEEWGYDYTYSRRVPDGFNPVSVSSEVYLYTGVAIDPIDISTMVQTAKEHAGDRGYEFTYTDLDHTLVISAMSDGGDDTWFHVTNDHTIYG